MTTLSKEAEDALLAVVERGEKHVVAPLGAARNELLDAGLIRHMGPGTRTTDTATPAGLRLASYIRRERAADALAEALLETEGDDCATVGEQEDDLVAAWEQYLAAQGLGSASR